MISQDRNFYFMQYGEQEIKKEPRIDILFIDIYFYFLQMTSIFSILLLIFLLFWGQIFPREKFSTFTEGIQREGNRQISGWKR